MGAVADVVTTVWVGKDNFKSLGYREYGGKAGFRHVLDGLAVDVAADEEDLVFSLVQLCASATGKPLTDDELRLIAGYPQELALLFPGQLG